jgi:hypothetical protein
MSTFIPEFMIKNYLNIFVKEIKQDIKDNLDTPANIMTGTITEISKSECWVNDSTKTITDDLKKGYIIIIDEVYWEIKSNVNGKFYLNYFDDIRMAIGKTYQIRKMILLEKIFYGFENQDDFSILEESIKLFRNCNIKTRIGLSSASSELPAFHILLPGENEEFTGIGMSPEKTYNYAQKEGKDFNNTIYNSRYSIMVISANGDTTVILYHILKYMFLRYKQSIEIYGMFKFKTGGNDIILDSNIYPQQVYQRNLNLEFSYNIKSESYNSELYGNGYNVDINKLDF